MCLFFETIQIKNGVIQNADLHNIRINETRSFYFKSIKKIDIRDLIKLKDVAANKILKCRIVYNEEVKSVEFLPYQIRTIQSIALIHANNIEYSYKSVDRNRLLELKSLTTCDEILIIKNNFITDTSFSNVILRKAINWFTPKSPLLNGIQRQQLLLQNKIKEIDIKFSEILEYDEIKLINAMMNFEDAITLPCSKVFNLNNA